MSDVFLHLEDPNPLERWKNEEKIMIKTVLAPEVLESFHREKHLLEKEEKSIIEQIKSHTSSFVGELGNVAKGDWVQSAEEEIKSITEKLNDLS